MAKQYGKKRSTFKKKKFTKSKFRKDAIFNKVIKRRFEQDIAVASVSGKASLMPSVSTLTQNISTLLSADTEFLQTMATYSYFRFTGISIEFCPLSNSKVPFNAFVAFRKLTATDVTDQTAPSDDNSLQCKTGTMTASQIKYYSCKYSSYQNESGYTIGGTQWTSTNLWSSSVYWTSLVIGQQIAMGEDSNYGIMRVKVYTEFCHPFSKN